MSRSETLRAARLARESGKRIGGLTMRDGKKIALDIYRPVPRR
jgi:hypothetical protein